MIITCVKADRFGGAAYYNDNKAKVGAAALLYTNMLGVTPKQLAFEFDAIAARNPLVKVPAEHIIMSLSPTDRKVSDTEFRMLAQAFLNERGYADCQTLLWRHFDRPNQHVHLLVSRVRADGSVVPNSLNHRKNRDFARRMEERLGLERMDRPVSECLRSDELGGVGRQNILY